jgi:hypothetical protein
VNNNINFNCYLFIEPKKIGISVNQISNFEEIYKREVVINNSINQIDFSQINIFLDDNIFKIENLLKNFVKNVNLILECNNFLTVRLSIKKDNNDEILTKKNLIYYLNEAKDQCEKTLKDNDIIHMIIEKYQIDNKDYSFFPDNLKCKNLILELKFICLEQNLIDKLRELLKKYQISIKNIVSADYSRQIFYGKNLNLYQMSQEVISGYNKNEILFVNKSSENKGFFEKFFNFFN